MAQNEDFVIPRKKPKRVPLSLSIKPEIDELFRSHCRRKGDMSRVFEEWVMEKWGPKTQT